MSVMADCERGMTVKSPVGIGSINHLSICFVCLFVSFLGEVSQMSEKEFLSQPFRGPH